jgi:hypothetical protein
MAVRAWCDGCTKYVVLTGEGLCPEGHPRPALRNLEEIPDGVQTLSADSPRVAAEMAANVASPGAVYPYDAKIPVVAGSMAVAGVALVYMQWSRVASPGLGGLVEVWFLGFFLWIAVWTATRPYAVTDDQGLVLWLPKAPFSIGARRRTIEWHQVTTGSRDGYTVRLELIQGGPALVYLANLRPRERDRLLKQLAQRLGTRWVHPAGETESINWGAASFRTSLPLLLLLVVVLAFFYLMRLHPDWIQGPPR